MTSLHEAPRPIDDLLSKLLDAKLDDMEQEELLGLLEHDPESRERYHEHIALHAMLHWIDSEPLELSDDMPASGMMLPDLAPASAPLVGAIDGALRGTMSYAFEGWPLAYMLATAIVVAGLMLGGLVSAPKGTQFAHDSPFSMEFWRNSTAPRVGRVTCTLDCVFSRGMPSARDGDYVSVGRPFNLETGLLEITYETGATVVLQGPVSYAVASANGGFLSSGKLVGKVTTERAKGFAVCTPTANVVDLGTEFGIEVDKDGATYSHVFAGAVRVELLVADHRTAGQAIDLHVNESAAVVKKGEAATGEVAIERGTADLERFVRPDELAQAANRRKSEPLRRWQEHADAMRRDPALVVFYDFQQRAESPEVLHANADGKAGAFDGVIDGATWGSGRMAGKQSLHFDGSHAAVKVNLARRMTEMTLAAWLTIESINDYDLSCGLLMSDGWVQSPNASEKVHWQIGRDGELFFGTAGWAGIRTSPMLGWREWGANRWRHLAVVVDPPHEKIAYYLDGKTVISAPVPETLTANFESAVIGSWRSEDGQVSRVFRGRIDELLVLARAMTDEEVKGLYESGRR